MKAKLTIQALSFEFETDGMEMPPHLGQMLMPHLPSIDPPPLSSPTALPAPTPREQKTLRNGKNKPAIAKAPAADAERLARKGSPRWDLYPMRTAQKRFPACRLCDRPIEPAQPYRDGGMDLLRAHDTCVVSHRMTAHE
ncbi:MAG: hypothetical protein ACRDRT_01220 [Pseudonocardiaceae bacterium]